MNSKAKISKVVDSNQDGVHKDLAKVIRRYSQKSYQRPIASFSIDTFNQMKAWIEDSLYILDLGCGTGRSSYLLGEQFRDYKILGIDKSVHRLNRKNDFKNDLPKNVRLYRGEILDLVYLFATQMPKKASRLFLLYPNPWPKAKLLKMRFHANPIMPFLLKSSNHITLRSNWRIYLDEFSHAVLYYTQSESCISQIKVKNYLTEFEAKYDQSEQMLYQLDTGDHFLYK